MRLVEMTCNSCNAQLELDLDKMQAFCPYCGKKLTVDVDKLSDVLIEKEKTNRDKVKREYDIQEKKLDFEQKQELGKKNARSSWIIAAVMWAVIGLVVFVVLSNGANTHKAKVTELQQIEQQVDAAILERQYDEALLLANKLRLDDGYSDAETSAWDAKRESYIKIINEQKQQ